MDPTSFTVGWICALPIELAAAQGMLEEVYHTSGLQKHTRDTNSYVLGRIASHKIALTCLPTTGIIDAGSAANHMSDTFTTLRYRLMVGIGGGVPSETHDIRLGDVVVSNPWGSYPGVVQYDYGRFIYDGEFETTGALPPPPRELLTAARVLVANHERESNRITHHLGEMLKKSPKMTQEGTDYRCPGKEHDYLWEAGYQHQGIKQATCEACVPSHLVFREERGDDEPVVHYGTIASASAVMRDGEKRDQLGKKYGALCFEMEAAGLMNDFPCLVIRGICDYADSHKNKSWQRYAAATAAAYAKELLCTISASLEGISTDSDPFRSAVYK